jgi:hypothetical protein
MGFQKSTSLGTSNIHAPTDHFFKWLTNKLKDFPDPPRTVRQEHTSIRREGKGHSTRSGQSAGLVQRRGARPQRSDSRGAKEVRQVATGCHLQKGGKAVHGAETIPVAVTECWIC